MTLRSFYDFEQPPLRLLVKILVPLILLGGLGTLGLWSLIYGMVERSEPVKLAEQSVNENASVEKYLGKPREVSLLPLEFSFHYNGTDGWSSFGLSVRGEKAKGTVYFRFTREVGLWKIDRANLVAESGQQVQLSAVAPDHSGSPGEAPGFSLTSKALSVGDRDFGRCAVRIQLTQPKQLVEIFLALFITALSLHAWFLRELRTRHVEVWRRLGEPSLFLNNSIRSGLRTLKFKWSSEATRDLGSRFRRLTVTLRVIDVTYLLAFIAIVWLRMTSHGE